MRVKSHSPCCGSYLGLNNWRWGHGWKLSAFLWETSVGLVFVGVVPGLLDPFGCARAWQLDAAVSAVSGWHRKEAWHWCWLSFFLLAWKLHPLACAPFLRMSFEQKRLYTSAWKLEA